MAIGGEDFVDYGPPMPRGLVDHDHHAWVVNGRVGPGNRPQMRRKARLQMAVFGDRGLLALPRPRDQARGQPATAKIQGTKDVERVAQFVTVGR